MISTTIFLTAGLMASPVIIQDVKASREAGHLRVEVAGDGGIDPDGARTRIDGGQLLIYLTGTRVREDNRSWDLAEGAGEIRAHRHKFETELVVPLAGNGCTGPVELEGSDTGITALVGCDGAPAARAEAKSKAKSKANEGSLKALVELPSEAAAPALAQAATKPSAAPERTASPAAVAAREAKPEAEAKAEVEAKPEAKGVKAVQPETKAETVPVANNKADTAEPTPAAPKTITDLLPATPAAATGTASASGGGSLRSIGMPAALLAILAVGAYLLARRRRTISVRHIQILETASLGPKRSLVVARVGDETLILGTSEAGITLLKNGAGEAGTAGAVKAGAVTTRSLGELETALVNTNSDVADRKAAEADKQAAAAALAQAEADAAAFEISQPLEEALADIPEPGDTVGNAQATRGGFRAIEGGLAGLLNDRRLAPAAGDEDEEGEAFPFETRSPARRGRAADARPSLRDRLKAGQRDRLRSETRDEDSFADLLEDSLEDQELRQKLAAGMSARVR